MQDASGRGQGASSADNGSDIERPDELQLGTYALRELAYDVVGHALGVDGPAAPMVASGLLMSTAIAMALVDGAMSMDELRGRFEQALASVAHGIELRRSGAV